MKRRLQPANDGALRLRPRARAIISLAATVAVAAIVPALPGAAQASTGTVACNGHTYGGDLATDGFPAIHNLRATGLPRLTDGYAPRCLVAESIAGIVQYRNGRTGKVWARGARWSAGIWHVSVREVDNGEGGTYGIYTARHGSQRVTFTGTA